MGNRMLMEDNMNQSSPSVVQMRALNKQKDKAGLVEITKQIKPLYRGQNDPVLDRTRQGRTIESMQERRDCSLKNKPVTSNEVSSDK